MTNETPRKRIKLTPSFATSPMATAKVEGPGFSKPDSMVTIKVQESAAYTQNFLVHKAHICFYSPYFAAALNGPFLEGEKQEIILDLISCKVFAVFIGWIYKQRIELPEEIHGVFYALTQLWILADGFLIPRLQNETLLLLNQRSGSFSISAVNSMYKQTTEGSPLRQFVIAGISSNSSRALQADVEEFSQPVLVDMVQWLQRERRNNGSKMIKFSSEELKQFYVDEQVKDSGLRQVGMKPIGDSSNDWKNASEANDNVSEATATPTKP